MDEMETCYDCGTVGSPEEVYPDRAYSEHREPICGDCWSKARDVFYLKQDWDTLAKFS